MNPTLAVHNHLDANGTLSIGNVDLCPRSHIAIRDKGQLEYLGGCTKKKVQHFLGGLGALTPATIKAIVKAWPRNNGLTAEDLAGRAGLPKNAAAREDLFARLCVAAQRPLVVVDALDFNDGHGIGQLWNGLVVRTGDADEEDLLDTIGCVAVVAGIECSEPVEEATIEGRKFGLCVRARLVVGRHFAQAEDEDAEVGEGFAGVAGAAAGDAGVAAAAAHDHAHGPSPRATPLAIAQRLTDAWPRRYTASGQVIISSNNNDNNNTTFAAAADMFVDSPWPQGFVDRAVAAVDAEFANDSDRHARYVYGWAVHRGANAPFSLGEAGQDLGAPMRLLAMFLDSLVAWPLLLVDAGGDEGEQASAVLNQLRARAIASGVELPGGAGDSEAGHGAGVQLRVMSAIGVEIVGLEDSRAHDVLGEVEQRQYVVRERRVLVLVEDDDEGEDGVGQDE